MDIIENAKSLAELIKKAGMIDEYRKIVELEGQIVTMSGDLVTLKRENIELRDALEIKAKMAFRPPFYFQDGDPDPFCPNCWETKRVATHLKDFQDKARRCMNCNEVFRDSGTSPTPRRPMRYGSR